MRKLGVLLGVLAVSAAGTSCALAQEGDAMHHHAISGTPFSASTKAYEAVMMRMHRGMAIDYSGDADRDFVSGMLPHHQGAVDMAKVELQYGKDPALHKLAADIIAAQEKEIAFMHRWQSAHDGRPHNQ